MKNISRYFLYGVVIFFLCISVSTYFIGQAIKVNMNIAVSALQTGNTSTGVNILDLSQTAQYLKMTEKEIVDIISLEKKLLETTGSFQGRMFPYFKVNDKYFFSKEELNEWVIDVSSRRVNYDLTKGYIY